MSKVIKTIKNEKHWYVQSINAYDQLPNKHMCYV